MGEKRKEPPPDSWPEGEAAGKKWVCLVRHQQALHNVHDENLWTPDNPLTPQGEENCKASREEWGSKIFDTAELVVVSPMRRALQTAYLLSGEDASRCPWFVTSMCAEKLSGATCDEGTPLSEVKVALPWMSDLPGVADLGQEWWKDERPQEELRVAAFLNFLLKRPEQKICVVSHGGFLEYISGYYMQNGQRHLMCLDDIKSAKHRVEQPTLNLNMALIKEYEPEPLKTIVKSPIHCLQGLGQRKSGILRTVGLKTVQDLAQWKYARWSESLCVLAPTAEEGYRDLSQHRGKMNINKALKKAWESYSFADLLDEPLTAFEGLTERHLKSLAPLGLRTVKDLGEWKFYKWAKAICNLAEVESVDGSS
eukprot:TRINITY_DN123565_c0_g1_i1.p1 TRINITY_DN123565_c0_g1~~TRINITY_DN123565_c0_g1_i1.p1  ORF type:complete len:380 (+),score=62.87 TRINITY_DN123565_c0_g1_i1:41-1141(+)